jgi:hypothetical protein
LRRGEVGGAMLVCRKVMPAQIQQKSQGPAGRSCLTPSSPSSSLHHHCFTLHKGTATTHRHGNLNHESPSKEKERVSGQGAQHPSRGHTSPHHLLAKERQSSPNMGPPHYTIPPIRQIASKGVLRASQPQHPDLPICMALEVNAANRSSPCQNAQAKSLQRGAPL